MPITTQRGSIQASRLQPTQNTAPVLEFRCLYTRDLRRKAKRWQDGFLRYHTFNRKIMVYDGTRNLIGATHGGAGSELQEGDELDLDNDATMVQVSEPIGVTQTDLTDLKKSREMKKGTSPAKKSNIPSGTGMAHNIGLDEVIRRHGPSSGASPSVVQSSGAPRHRSLGALLGTPKGPIGKAAISDLSPFEQRQKRNLCEAETPAKKRRKPNAAPTDASASARLALDKTHVTLPSPLAKSSAPVIDLCSDSPEKPYSSPFNSTTTATAHRPGAAPGTEMRLVDGNKKHEDPYQSSPFFGSTASEQREPLKVVVNQRNRMLICQRQPELRNERRGSAPNSKNNSMGPELKSATAGSVGEQRDEQGEPSPHQARLQERLMRMEERRKAAAATRLRTTVPPQQIIVSPPRATKPVSREQRRPPAADSGPTSIALSAASIAPSPATSVRVASEEQPAIMTATSSTPDMISAPVTIAAAPGSVDVPVAPSRVQPLRRTSPIKPRQLGDPVIVRPRRDSQSSTSSRTSAIPRRTAKVPDSNTVELNEDVNERTRAGKPALTRKISGAAVAGIAQARVDPAVQNAAPPKPTPGPLDIGPWSREALDLFSWWPPDRDEAGNKIPTREATVAV